MYSRTHITLRLPQILHVPGLLQCRKLPRDSIKNNKSGRSNLCPPGTTTGYRHINPEQGLKRKVPIEKTHATKNRAFKVRIFINCVWPLSYTTRKASLGKDDWRIGRSRCQASVSGRLFSLDRRVLHVLSQRL